MDGRRYDYVPNGDRGRPRSLFRRASSLLRTFACRASASLSRDNPSGVNPLAISPLCRTLNVCMAGRHHLVRMD
jgi:hypothetical protein